jgi:LPXTG-site transpeptidase (sortase) family protein
MTHRRRASSRRQILPGVLLLAVGVVIAVGAPTIWSRTHQDPGLQAIDSGIAVQLAQKTGPSLPLAAPVRGSASTTTSAKAPSTSPSSASPSPARPAPARNTATAAPSPAKKSPAATTRAASSGPKTPTPLPRPAVELTPTRLQIPAIGVDAPVEAVGVDDEGEMAIPEKVQQIGWYRYGAAPGDAGGSVVMSGHVDSAVQGLGAFAHLSDVAAGDTVTVSDAVGHQLKYRVVGKEAFDKKSVPLSDLFSRKGTARLTLITCGGGFNSVIHSYLDNIVITAVPA